LIELKNISKTYKISKREKGFFGALKSLFARKYEHKQALKDASFSIKEGEIVGYIGPNGAGKSTTIKIMSGILTPDDNCGTCLINGFIPWKNRVKYVKHIGAVFGQRSNLSWDVPIIDSFLLLKEIYKIPENEFYETLEKLSTKLDLKELLNRPLRQLSLGQKMKCEIAAALLHRPKILFLDEPTIGLDSVSKLAVRNFIKEINKETNVTIILTTHDMNDIEAVTNRIILIGKGQILFDGDFEQIKKRYSKIKTIEVEFEKDYDNVEIEGYELLKHNKTSAVYKSEKENFKLTKFIELIEKKFKISDINITGIELEEIISNLYREFEI
jgi:ABC-2 type transport system ATP-binding protein